MTLVDAAQLGGAIVDNLAALFEERPRDERVRGLPGGNASGRKLLKTSFEAVPRPTSSTWYVARTTAGAPPAARHRLDMSTSGSR